MVAKGVEQIAVEKKQVGGQLGRPSGARFRTYERLKRHADKVKGELFYLPYLGKAIEEICRFPLRQSATDTLNRQMKAGTRPLDQLGKLIDQFPRADDQGPDAGAD